MTKKKQSNKGKGKRKELNKSDFYLQADNDENLTNCVNDLKISQSSRGAAGKRSRKKTSSPDSNSKSLANTYDIYNAYSQAVQNCSKEVQNLLNLDKHLQHSLSALELPRFPRIFREDFCGTGKLCEVWRDTHVSRFAYGLDISSEPVCYGRDRLRDSGKLDRVGLFIGNVLDFEYDLPPHYNNSNNPSNPANLEYEDFSHTLTNPEIEAPSDSDEESEYLESIQLETSHIPKVDIICALNYALFYHHKRSDLVNYLTLCKNRLRAKGTLICDIFGGLHAIHPTKQLIKRLPDFDYYLRISEYNPLHQTIRLGLNFKFKDGSWNKGKFSYTFRVYTLPEIIEAFKEAGFKTIEVWMASTPTPTTDYSSDDSEISSNEPSTESEGTTSGDDEEVEEEEEEEDDDDDDDEEEEDPFKDYIQITSQTKQFPLNWNAYIVASPTPKFK